MLYKLIIGCIVLVCIGCLSDETSKMPLVGKEQSLLGTWQLMLENTDPEVFRFNYGSAQAFSFANGVGGTFLKRIADLNEIDGIDIDFVFSTL